MHANSLLGTERIRGARILLASLPLGLYWLLNGFLLSSLDPLRLLLVDFVALVGGVVATLGILRQRLGVTFDELGLRRSPRGARGLVEDSVVCVVATLSIGWVVFTLAWWLIWPIDWMRETGSSSYSWYRAMFESVGRLPAVLYLATTAALFEEIYFRGLGRIVAFSLASPGRAPLVYCVISAAWFGAGHWESGLTSIIASTLVGVLLARLYLWTDNLWPVIIAHFVQDFVHLSIS